MTHEELIAELIKLGYQPSYGPDAKGKDKYLELCLIQIFLLITFKVITSVGVSIIPEAIAFNYRVIDGSLGRFDERVFSKYIYTDSRKAFNEGIIFATQYIIDKQNGNLKDERAAQIIK